MLIVYARQAVEYVWILFLVVWFSAALTTKRRQKSAGSGLRRTGDGCDARLRACKPK